MIFEVLVLVRVTFVLISAPDGGSPLVRGAQAGLPRSFRTHRA